MATVEERLARLEGKTLPVQQMRADLYEDYLQIRLALKEAEENLIKARMEEVEAHKELKDAREAYEMEEKAMLATDERAGGPNDTMRKRNAENLIRQERVKGGKMHQVWLTMMQKQHNYEVAVAHKEGCIDAFSSARYLLRTISGLAYAMGG